MATSLNLLSKVVSNKVEGFFKSDESEKVPPSEKELKVGVKSEMSYFFTRRYFECLRRRRKESKLKKMLRKRERRDM